MQIGLSYLQALIKAAKINVAKGPTRIATWTDMHLHVNSRNNASSRGREVQTETTSAWKVRNRGMARAQSQSVASLVSKVALLTRASLILVVKR